MIASPEPAAVAGLKSQDTGSNFRKPSTTYSAASISSKIPSGGNSGRRNGLERAVGELESSSPGYMRASACWSVLLAWILLSSASQIFVDGQTLASGDLQALYLIANHWTTPFQSQSDLDATCAPEIYCLQWVPLVRISFPQASHMSVADCADFSDRSFFAGFDSRFY